MRKKLFVMSLVVLIGCSSILVGAQDKPVTLKFWRAGLDETTREFYQREIERYESTHPNVKIEYSEYNWGNDMETKLNLGFASHWQIRPPIDIP